MSVPTMTNDVAFYEAAELTENRQKHYSDKRRNESEYANILIFKCDHKAFWYYYFVGFQCFDELHFVRYPWTSIRYLNSVTVIRLTGTRVLRGRQISPEDIIIL